MKTIGILGRYTAERSLCVTYPYISFAKSFNKKRVNIVIVDPISQQINTNLDLLILPGGEDVDPARYQEVPDIECKNPNIHFESFDRNLLPQYIDARIPIFGICRGFQTLNVHFGGKLAQHIPQEVSNKSREEKVHDVVFNDELPNDFVNRLVPKYNSQETNSLHHQGIYPEILSDQLVSVAEHKKLNNIEAFAHRDLPIIAVQWHPEEIYDEFSVKSIRYLLEQK